MIAFDHQRPSGLIIGSTTKACLCSRLIDVEELNRVVSNSFSWASQDQSAQTSV
jgi:hypothetical protein